MRDLYLRYLDFEYLPKFSNLNYDFFIFGQMAIPNNNMQYAPPELSAIGENAKDSIIEVNKEMYIVYATVKVTVSAQFVYTLVCLSFALQN